MLRERFRYPFKKTSEVFDDNSTIYDILLKILQQGHNVREATLAESY